MVEPGFGLGVFSTERETCPERSMSNGHGPDGAIRLSRFGAKVGGVRLGRIEGGLFTTPFVAGREAVTTPAA